MATTHSSTVPPIAASAPADQPPSPESIARVRRLDAFGVVVSSICAVHCVIVALFLAAMPIAGATFISDPRLELTFVASALVIGFVSLGMGFWRVHRDERPMIAFAIGSLFLLGLRSFALHLPVLEAAIVVLGASAIITGHLWNRRLLHRHTVCGAGHSHDRPHAI
jgi:hypothetical protein